MTLPIEPSLLVSVGREINEFLTRTINIQDMRKKYYEQGKTIYIVGTTPSGIYAGLAASQITRIPLLGATNRPEPIGHEDTVNYVGLDGCNYSIYGLKPGDGVVLVTGELADGEEQARIIKSLRDKSVDILCSVSVVENEYYAGRDRIKSLKIPLHSIKTYKVNEGIYWTNISSKAYDSFVYAIGELNRIVKSMNLEAGVVEV
jgi:adenine/guanine phosphoribosyltransferase-like PRPP-binding protein